MAWPQKPANGPGLLHEFPGLTQAQRITQIAGEGDHRKTSRGQHQREAGKQLTLKLHPRGLQTGLQQRVGRDSPFADHIAQLRGQGCCKPGHELSQRHPKLPAFRSARAMKLAAAGEDNGSQALTEHRFDLLPPGLLQAG